MKKASWLIIILLLGAMLAGCDSVSSVLPIRLRPTPTPVPPVAPAQQYASSGVQVSAQAPVHVVLRQAFSYTVAASPIYGTQTRSLVSSCTSGDTVKMPGAALANLAVNFLPD